MNSITGLQKGNPVLKHIHNVKWTFQEDMQVDFKVGELSCALFLR